VGTSSFGVVDLAAAVLTLATLFFLDFPVAGLGAAVDFGSGFSGLTIFLGAVTICCSGAPVTGCVGGL
jgi:NCAIR mutase (PurE)-related protein